jgi:hypothetical protein
MWARLDCALNWEKEGQGDRGLSLDGALVNSAASTPMQNLLNEREIADRRTATVELGTNSPNRHGV